MALTKDDESQGNRIMKINPDFASPCGLYCGVCAIYMAHRDNNQKLKEGLVRLYQGRQVRVPSPIVKNLQRKISDAMAVYLILDSCIASSVI